MLEITPNITVSVPNIAISPSEKYLEKIIEIISLKLIKEPSIKPKMTSRRTYDLFFNTSPIPIQKFLSAGS
jgi:hypothetical protein